MSTMELAPYSEARRDRIEEQLALEANKREILGRKYGGYEVIAYWLVKENVCLIYVHDARLNEASEFVVPNDEVAEWFNHPFAHKDNTIPRYEQRGNAND